ncbi:MAG: response regulator transcription factor [Bacteroidetes bacterium]|nr:response regulator transcription factor [Bacteroidota bacterium]
MKKIRVFLADDHKLIRDAIHSHLRKCDDIEVVGEAADGNEVLEKMQTIEADILLLDINMDGMDGMECARHMQTEFPKVKVIILSMYDNSLYIKQMIKNGVVGYLLKHSDESEIINAIRTIAEGNTYYDSAVIDVVIKSFSDKDKRTPEPSEANLTPREKEIMELIIKEYTNQEIAEELFISTRTVDAHKRNLLEKTNSKNLVGLIKYAYSNNLVSAE